MEDRWMHGKERGECRKRVSSVRLVCEHLLYGWRESQFRSFIPGVFPPELFTGPRWYLECDVGEVLTGLNTKG